MAAFTYGVDQKTEYPSSYQSSKKMIGKDNPDKRSLEYEVGQLYYVSGDRGFRKTGNRKRTLKLPRNYQYDDARPNSAVKPTPIFGKLIGKGESHTQRFAQWMTSPDNERFTKTIANYMWNKVMGYGLFNPIDELKDDTAISNPELMKHLESMMISLNYDMKQFMRVLYNTKVYQRESALADINLEKPYHFPGPVMKRMSAEQIWDSMIALTIPEPDKRVLRTAQIYAQREAEVARMKELAEMNPEEVYSIAQRIVAARNEVSKEMNDLNAKIRDADRKKLTTKANRLRYDYAVIRTKRDKKIRKIRGESSGMMMDDMASMTMTTMTDMMGDGGSKKDNEKLNEAWKSFNKYYVRASELSSPARPGHFLQQFGQSNREIIGNFSREPSVSQVLTLLNGPHFKEMMKPESVLSKNLAKVGSTDRRMKVVFLSILNREPTKDDITLFKKEARRKVKVEKDVYGYKPEVNKDEISKGYSNVIWALLNTRQFQYVQ